VKRILGINPDLNFSDGLNPFDWCSMRAEKVLADGSVECVALLPLRCPTKRTGRLSVRNMVANLRRDMANRGYRVKNVEIFMPM